MKEKRSKFSGILDARKEEPILEAGQEASPLPSIGPSRPKAAAATGGEGETAHKRQRGRPKANGKRLNPDYTQVTAYIPADLHTETKINLIKSGKREFSILIEELLTTWNKKTGLDQQNA